MKSQNDNEDANFNQESSNESDSIKPAASKEEKSESDEVIGYESEKQSKLHHTHRNHRYSSDNADGYILPVHRKKRRKKHKKNKKKMGKVKKTFLIIGSVLLALVLAAIAAFFVMFEIGRKELLGNTGETIVIEDDDVVQDDIDKNLIIYKGEKYSFNENITSILFMGVDKNFDSQDDIQINNMSGSGGQSDMLILAAMDITNGKTTLINIPRDTMASIGVFDNDGVFKTKLNAQICLAYAYGDGKVISCENAINAVSELFHGVPINSYFSFEIDSMPVLTDAIGGVDLTALETIGNFTEGEQVHLNSSNVESYLRSRRFDIIDASSLRQKRQMQFIQEYIKLAVDKTKSDITTPLNIYNTMKDYMVTNIGANKVTFLAGTYLTSGVDTAGITTLQGQTKMGETYVEFYPDEAAKLDLFIKTYYTKVTE